MFISDIHKKHCQFNLVNIHLTSSSWRFPVSCHRVETLSWREQRVTWEIEEGMMSVLIWPSKSISKQKFFREQSEYSNWDKPQSKNIGWCHLHQSKKKIDRGLVHHVGEKSHVKNYTKFHFWMWWMIEVKKSLKSVHPIQLYIFWMLKLVRQFIFSSVNVER